MSDRASRDDGRDAALIMTEERQQALPDSATRPVSDTRRQESSRSGQSGVHPMVAKIAIGAAVWFLAIVWFSFAWGAEVDFLLAIVTLFFVMFFTLFLLTATYGLQDPRWRLPQTSFSEFLVSNVGTATGTMRGRDVLIEIALVPVSLALAGTLIGLVWVFLH
jgi:hypothetical protein